ncbi:hypothetical protein LTR37_015379 [Vermiconidia calcicola]|uniref:Uncharacterized protein n=1 Tax=Vermiconidia calcicola TaxID=1690605 RepID=A0ACC3MQX7_9PEZI|nr:hypothetical protein LTR37_015379 [Vermiconidia calcicola]
MSSETADSGEMATKKKKDKHKKSKGHTDNNSKKRKREVEQQEADEVVPDSQPSERATKKQKKRRRDEDAPASRPEPTESKKSKKRKKDHDSTIQTNDALEPADAEVDSGETRLKSHSPFKKQTTSFYLPLSPCAYNFPLEGLCAEHISPLLLTYFPPLKGVLLSFENPRLSEEPGNGVHVKTDKGLKRVLSRSIDEYAVSYIWLTADFLTFKPSRGTYLEGYVSLQNEGMLGLVCYNYFNAVIERDKLPKDWRWIEDEDQPKIRKKKFSEGGGHFVDGNGSVIEGRIVFRVDDFEATPGSDTGAGTVSILGSLSSDGEGT